MIDYNSISFDELPNDDLKIIATDCGIDIARMFLKSLPGITLMIPKKVNIFNPSVKIMQDKLGDEIVERIIRTIGGISVCIPKNFSPLFIERYIREHFDGVNIKQIAIDLQISERAIYNFLNRMRRKKNKVL